MNRHDQTILLGEVLQRQMPTLQRTALLSGTRSLLGAVHRCRKCVAHAQCETWLRTGAQEGHGAFCPNAGYIAYLKALAA